MSSRSIWLDGLKALASQLIVLHHLSAYAPSAGDISEGLQALLDAFLDYGRLAVPVFLVLAGFLAGRSLKAAELLTAKAVVGAVARRWRRLTPSYWSALAVCVLACGLARSWTDLEALPDPPTLAQGLAHVLMLQDILGYDALSAGVWYVAIDLQLYALLAVLLALAARVPMRHAPTILVSAMVAASWLGFNRFAEGDTWAPYFFGAYGLGVLAAWQGNARKPWLGALGMAALGALALVVEFRSRVAVATLTALLLTLTALPSTPTWGRAAACLRWLSQISYSVFLMHFAAAMLCFAAIERFVPDSPLAWTLLLAWAASVGLGALAYHWIEAPRASPQGLTRLLTQISARGALSSASCRSSAHVSASMDAPPTRSM